MCMHRIYACVGCACREVQRNWLLTGKHSGPASFSLHQGLSLKKGGIKKKMNCPCFKCIFLNVSTLHNCSHTYLWALFYLCTHKHVICLCFSAIEIKTGSSTLGCRRQMSSCGRVFLPWSLTCALFTDWTWTAKCSPLKWNARQHSRIPLPRYVALLPGSTRLVYVT